MDAQGKLNQIEDILVNYYGMEEEPLTINDLRTILDHITLVLESKRLVAEP